MMARSATNTEIPISVSIMPLITIQIKRLPTSVSSRFLARILEPVGDQPVIVIKFDARSGTRFASVQYETREAAAQAISILTSLNLAATSELPSSRALHRFTDYARTTSRAPKVKLWESLPAAKSVIVSLAGKPIEVGVSDGYVIVDKVEGVLSNSRFEPVLEVRSEKSHFKTRQYGSQGKAVHQVYQVKLPEPAPKPRPLPTRRKPLSGM